MSVERLPAGWEEFEPDMENHVEHEPPQVKVTDIATFAAVDEATAVPLIGDENTCLLSHGGMMKFYGDGGAGKTTLEVDFLLHLATATDWLGLAIPERAKILIIENEGPRGMFRKKLRRKLEAWEGPEVGEQIHVFEDPWALFTFGEEVFRSELRKIIEQFEFDVVAAGPVQRLGIKGGGTPEEVSAFILDVELVRQHVERPVAAVLVGHENKAGDVAGAWEGVPDTLCHVSNRGNGKTHIHWQKVRWGPSLHGKSWDLAWAENEGFEIVERIERTEEEIRDDLIAYLEEHSESGWGSVRDAVEGRGELLQKVRNDLLGDGTIVNLGSANKMRLSVNGSRGSLAGNQGGTGAEPLWEQESQRAQEEDDLPW